MTKPLIPGGYILLSRKLIESDIWNKPPLYIKVWIYLLCKAQHDDYKNLNRGQLITSIPEIQEACSWQVGYRKVKPSKDQVFQVIEWLRNPVGKNSRKGCEHVCEHDTKATMITTMKATHGLLINIDNYTFYQDPKNYESNDESIDEKVTKATSEQRQPDNINKNDKECTKNDKNDKYIKKDNTITSAKSAMPPMADSEKLLSRYTPEQQELITRYWDTIRFTRKNAKIADSIKIREMEYWARFPADIVIEAIKIHISRYQTKPEEYTRGIMRRLAREREMGRVPTKAPPENDDNSVYDNLF